MTDSAELESQRRAIETFTCTLRRAVDHQPLWETLGAQAAGADPIDLSMDGARDFLIFIGNILSDAHANLLYEIGYRVPPPPPIKQVVEKTRRAVLWGDRQPRWGRWHVEEAKAGLIEYLERLEQVPVLASAGFARTLMVRLRNVGVVAVLGFLLGDAEVKTGDQFGVALGFSAQDRFKVELTVPAPWAESGDDIALLRYVITNSQIANLGETVDRALDREEQHGQRWYDGQSSLDDHDDIGEANDETNWSSEDDPDEEPTLGDSRSIADQEGQQRGQNGPPRGHRRSR